MVHSQRAHDKVLIFKELTWPPRTENKCLMTHGNSARANNVQLQHLSLSSSFSAYELQDNRQVTPFHWVFVSSSANGDDSAYIKELIKCEAAWERTLQIVIPF